MKRLIALLTFAISSCASSPVGASDPAVENAETYVYELGFTPAGLPAGQPLKAATINDIYFNQEDLKNLVDARKNTIQGKAFCVIPLGGDSSYVLFKLTRDPSKSLAVLANASHNPVQVMHMPLDSNDSRCRKLNR